MELVVCGYCAEHATSSCLSFLSFCLHLLFVEGRVPICIRKLVAHVDELVCMY
jgi:hypothetical protein